jgi:8-oxo-dGTP diphosphatase
MNAEVRAAGGVVRRVVDGGVLTVLVHRPRYDDWSLPKGKLLDGESFQEAAAREVREETGLECRIGVELPSSSYTDHEGRSKVVRFWSMESADGLPLHPTGEVDEARWFGLSEARAALTYERDREVLDAVVNADAPAYLVRHAKAGDRDAWSGDDGARPLSKSGRRQAKALVRVLSSRPVERIVSSPAERCLETVRPLAEQRGLSIESRDELLEGASLPGLLGVLDEARSTPVVLCAHGDLIPEAVEDYEARGATVPSERGWKKGSIWVLEREAGLVVRATYIPPPDVDPKPRARRQPRGSERRRT